MGMLVLSRKRNEAITMKLVTPDGKEQVEVHITIVDLIGGRVRLGIDAPRDIKILRDELLEQQEPAPKKTTKKPNLEDVGTVK